MKMPEDYECKDQERECVIILTDEDEYEKEGDL